ncbi:hypothetical protein MNBD_GAMMA15-398 [hydrothermal vent metagenome]|uniref:SlyX protein n=1 Tax=hydrothermal vent metagenome TaxID=652676 RepID=A0A3B0YBF0_9ZZZZ
MSNNDSDARIEALEIRLTHQEAALEALTSALLSQERNVREHTEALERLELQLRALAPADGARPADEKPPHY